MRPYYLHKRNGIYYAELVDVKTKKKLPARSTGFKNAEDARDTVRSWLREGVPDPVKGVRRRAEEVISLSSILSGLRSIDLRPADAEKIAGLLKELGLLASFSITGSQSSELIVDFLARIWTYDESPYVAEKLAHGHSLHRDHCCHSLGRIKNYWLPAFRGRRLAEITKADLKAFSVSLASPDKGLSPATRNRILIAGTAPLRWAFENDLIPEDITRGLSTFSGKPKERGVLTPEEAAGVFSVAWKDEKARLGSLVAATTGLRCREIRAIQAEDIDEFGLNVRHSWANVDGLKSPKSNKARRVPLLPEVRDGLLALLEQKPYGKGRGFIFWSANPDQPIGHHVFLDYLRQALITYRAGDDPSEEARAEADKYWKDRAITFHSWRHFYSSRMADRIDARTVMLATGHSTKSVFEAYADHALQSDLERVAEATNEAFGGIIPGRDQETHRVPIQRADSA